jgi:DNA-directed RNA polymerase subunit M/transcription elongation factor TFIIS
MMSSSKRQSGGGKTTTTTCDKCGETHVVYPPSPDYPNMLLQPCPQLDSLERAFECKKCGQINKRHWDRRHFIAESVNTC